MDFGDRKYPLLCRIERRNRYSNSQYQNPFLYFNPLLLVYLLFISHYLSHSFYYYPPHSFHLLSLYLMPIRS